VSEEVSLEAVGKDVFEIRLQRPERMNALGCDLRIPEILGSRDYSEGLAAFAERRPPRFMEVVQ
jgi:enoyl-CoA hydratase/carnithine racemase